MAAGREDSCLDCSILPYVNLLLLPNVPSTFESRRSPFSFAPSFAIIFMDIAGAALFFFFRRARGNDARTQRCATGARWLHDVPPGSPPNTN